MSRYLQVGDGYAAVLIVTGYPAEVGAAWLDPLLGWPGRLDVVVHVDPLTPQVAAARLRKQRARLESNRRTDTEKGRLLDPAAEAAAELADRIARGHSKLFRVGLYLCVHATTVEELQESIAHVRAVAASVLLDTQPATWRQLQGWISTLPLATDNLGMRRVMDTEAIATMFPLASPDLPAPLPGEPAPAGGMLYGVNPDSAGIVWWDRWNQHNANSVVLARSGAGKSYFVKLGVLRSLADGVHVSVIDPDNEYHRLAGAVGGITIHLGAGGVRLNPLDIPPGDRRDDALTRRALFLHTLIAMLPGEQPPPAERAALDKAIIAAYATAGISNDPDTWQRQAPLLRDVSTALAADGSDAAPTLAARLTPWISGSFKELFDGPTTTVPHGQLVVWSTRQLADELRAPGNATLTLVPSLLQDKQFRAAFTADLDDPEGLLGFWQWFESTPPPVRSQVIGPVLARLRSFLTRPFVGQTIGAPRSTVDMRRVIDGGSLLARLPKGQIGEETSRLMGSFILASAWQAATARTRIAEQDRRDAVAYIDESHNFLNLPGSVGDMLAEARGYRFGLVLAHQNLTQMPRDTQLALSSNARNKVYFSCAPEDAHQLARHTMPELSEHDLSHLDAFQAARRLVVDGRETPSFTLLTQPAKPVVDETTAVRQAALANVADPDNGPAAIARLAGVKAPDDATTQPDPTPAADSAA
ncbi:helicase HerA domain-containing protein [Dactylosporangium salmoneum]|uniref:Helicase HerA central domain-containing protein n=1 Tax=Dactylosporangium salmoneum TaxID=53361 RepID=A0ABN3FWR7_9ACTN